MIQVTVDGVETTAFPVVDENGRHMQQDGAFVYEAQDGLHISIQHEEATPSPTLAVAAAAVHSSPPPAPTPPPAPADGAMREVWSANKAKFLICKYKELKDKIGTSGGFKTKKAMWEKLAHEINSSFGCQMTALQVENKWKTMERAYKKTKMRNGSTGRPRAACEFEDELSEVLEREHHITPVALLAPGRIVANREGENMMPENEPADDGGDEAPAEEAPPRSREATALRGGGSRQRPTAIGSLIRVMQDAMAAKQKQHDEKMRLLERLVEAVEANK